MDLDMYTGTHLKMEMGATFALIFTQGMTIYVWNYVSPDLEFTYTALSLGTRGVDPSAKM